MKFKAKKRVILSDFEPFLTLKFAKKMFSRAMLPYRAVAKATTLIGLRLLCTLLLLQIGAAPTAERLRPWHKNARLRKDIF